MSYNEYNYFQEHKDFKENKPFEILPQNKKDKEISTPKLETYNSSEFGSFVKKQVKNKDNKNIVKKLIEKVSQTTSSIASAAATTAAVVISSVVLFTNLINILK